MGLFGPSSPMTNEPTIDYNNTIHSWKSNLTQDLNFQYMKNRDNHLEDEYSQYNMFRRDLGRKYQPKKDLEPSAADLYDTSRLEYNRLGGKRRENIGLNSYQRSRNVDTPKPKSNPFYDTYTSHKADSSEYSYKPKFDRSKLSDYIPQLSPKPEYATDYNRFEYKPDHQTPKSTYKSGVNIDKPASGLSKPPYTQTPINRYDTKSNLHRNNYSPKLKQDKYFNPDPISIYNDDIDKQLKDLNLDEKSYQFNSILAEMNLNELNNKVTENNEFLKNLNYLVDINEDFELQVNAETQDSSEQYTKLRDEFLSELNNYQTFYKDYINFFKNYQNMKKFNGKLVNKLKMIKDSSNENSVIFIINNLLNEINSLDE